MEPISMSAFTEEFCEIAKNAGVLGFLGKGLGHMGHVLRGKSVPGATAAGGIGKHVKSLWGAGSEAAKAKGTSGFLGGLKGVAGSPYGQMAAAGAVPIAAGYGIHKMTS